MKRAVVALATALLIVTAGCAATPRMGTPTATGGEYVVSVPDDDEELEVEVQSGDAEAELEAEFEDGSGTEDDELEDGIGAAGTAV